MPVSNGSSVFNVDPSSNNNLTATFNAIDESCIGSTGAEDGQLTVNVSGGSGMYEVLWVTCPNGQLNCEGETDWTISGLMAGDYTVVVTDTDTGCSSQFTTTVNLGPCCELSMGTTLTPPDVCAGESVYQLLVDIQNQIGITTITITPDDGVVALGSGQYEISDCGLDYTVTVTDGSGCNPVSDVIFIDCVNFSPPTFDIAVSEMDCRPEDGSYTPSNGEISVNVTGGSDCMTYSWECPVSMENCPPPSSDPNLSNAVVGWYTLTWEDCTYGCTGTETIQVTTVPCCSVDFSPVVTNIIGCNSCSGSIVLNPSVSQLNYQYQW
ncbi:MAG: hypothetical protein ACPGED_13000, partial [Flavobacteriales bacterium]